MLAGQFKIMAVDIKKGEKNGRPWEMIEVTAQDAGEAPMLRIPLVFNLEKQDADMATTLEGKVIGIALQKVDVYNGKLDFKCRVSRKDWEAACAASPAPLPTRPAPPASVGAPVTR